MGAANIRDELVVGVVVEAPSGDDATAAVCRKLEVPSDALLRVGKESQEWTMAIGHIVEKAVRKIEVASRDARNSRVDWLRCHEPNERFRESESTTVGFGLQPIESRTTFGRTAKRIVVMQRAPARCERRQPRE